jgi:hypothetical protein
MVMIIAERLSVKDIECLVRERFLSPWLGKNMIQDEDGETSRGRCDS